MKEFLKRLTNPDYYLTEEQFKDRFKKMSLKLYEQLRDLQEKSKKTYDNKFDMVHDRVGDLEGQVGTLDEKVDLILDLLSRNLDHMKSQKPIIQEKIIERVIETSTSTEDKVKTSKSVLPEEDEVGFIPDLNTEAMKVRSKKKSGVVKKDVDESFNIGDTLDALDKLNNG